MASTFKRRSSGGGRVTTSTSATTASSTAAAAAAGTTADATKNQSILTDNSTGDGGGVSHHHVHGRLKGTKLWTGGITLTSSGLRDLDNLLGSGTAAGQPLGTCLWLEQDRWTHQSLSLSLVKYWCAETISHGQHLVIPIDTLVESKDDTEDVSNNGDDDHWDETNDDNDANSCTIVNSQLSEVQSLLDALPRNLHWDRQQQKAAAKADEASRDQQQLQQQHVLDTLQEEEEEDDDNDDDDDDGDNDAEQGLKIAWQYRKSVQREMLGGYDQHASSSSSQSRRSKSNLSGGDDGVFCHSFDLQGRLKDQGVDNNKTVDILLPSAIHQEPHSSSLASTCGFALYRQIQAKLQELLLLQSSSSSSATTTRQVVRLLFYHSNPCILQIALPLTLAYIRHYQLPVVVMIATCPWKHQNTHHHHHHRHENVTLAMRLLRRMSDVVLETEGFASRSGDFYPPPPEFRNFQGLLRVVKMNTVTAATAVSTGGTTGTTGSSTTTTTTGGGGGAGGHFADRTLHKGPAADLYGLKRDRRKLHIQLLHIPPEDYAQGGGSVGGGGVRSGAGRVGTSGGSGGGGGCGSSSGGGGLALDF